MRIAEYLDRAAEIAPNKEAFKDAQGSLSFAEAAVKVNVIAAALAADTQTHQKVAIYSPNNTAAFLSMLALNKADIAWIPINHKYPLETIIDLLDFTGVDTLVFHSNFSDETAVIRERVNDVHSYICLDRPSDIGPSIGEFGKGFEGSFDLGPEDPRRTIIIAATGGTTGRPKGVEHSHRSYETCVLNMNITMKVEPEPRHLIFAPLTHVTGFLAACFMAAQGTSIILDGFDAGLVLEAIEQEKITHLFLPPTAFYALLDHPDTSARDLASLQNMILGSAPVSPVKFRRGIEIFGPCMTEAFGQMETLFPQLLKTSDDYLDEKGNVLDDVLKTTGRPGFASRVAIMDDDGTLLPPGNRGEMVIRCSSVMERYYNNPAATSEVAEHGWHHTGDIGLIDTRGYVTIVDRKKDMIISGGYNIYPAEIEDALNELPEVENCAVVGVPDEKWGEAVKAVVKLRPRAVMSEDAITKFCKERLGSIKAPKSVEFWTDLPLSPVGKVLKREIRDRFWSSETRVI